LNDLFEPVSHKVRTGTVSSNCNAFSNANHQLHFRLASVLIIPIHGFACIDMNKNLVMQFGYRSQTLKTIPVIGQGPSHPAGR
jgi:hypothetical protein